MRHAPIIGGVIATIVFGISVLLLEQIMMLSRVYLFPLLSLKLPAVYGESTANNATVDLSWHAPSATQVNNLASAINGTGVYGFIFNSSVTPGDYKDYNWCNMPHVRPQEYQRAPEGYDLEYVELIHRHHKRTPYAANTFPVESYPWYCNDEGLFFYGKPLNPNGNNSASTYWSVYTSPSNPFAPQGFNGTCQLPQITRGGLDDSHQHGLDLFAVYHTLLGFLPSTPGPSVSYRVTNNVITSQVAGMVIAAMLAPPSDYPLSIQPASVDSLEPTYTCPTATALRATYGVSSHSPAWLAHLTAASPLFASLDAISGVPANSTPFHMSLDHYYDNLSARLCHAKPLPCQLVAGKNSSTCITPAQADQVFRLGQYEYSFLYRDAGPQTLQASVAAYGVFVAELAQHIRDRVAGASAVVYRHNIAHDGSVAPLLSILQVDVMVWPGMGAEVVFEVYRKGGERFVRVLWGGQVLRSSNPDLGVLDMLPVGTLLAYFDGLVGVGAGKVPGLCGLA